MDGAFVKICSVSDLPGIGELREITAGKQVLCVANIAGKICAIDNECPHHGGPLGEGMIENGKVVCPWHAYSFDPVTGACVDSPKTPVRVFEIAVSGEDVLAKL
jgi:nitrite reductase (NADH) small subunit